MKKILFLFLVVLMLVSCDSPVQENEEQPVVETTEKTKVEETKEEPEQVIEEQKPQEEKAAEEPKEEPKEEQPVEETKEKPAEVTEPEEPQETVEEPVEETPVEEPTEEPEVKEQPEEIIEQPVVIDTWIKVNTTDGTFGIPYFVVPKGYDPMNFNRNFITEKFRNSNFLKFKKVNQTLVHKNKDNYKSSTFAFWKGDSQARTFESEVDVYEVYIYSTYTEDSVYITYDDLFISEKNFDKPAFLLRNEDDVWNVYSALKSNGTTYIPDNSNAKYTAKVISYYK